MRIRAHKSPSNLDFGRVLRRAARLVSRAYRRRIADLDLTERQATAILTVVNTPAITLGQLAETLGADQATASAVIDRLLAADLIRRETDAGDRRRASLQPTEKASRLAEGLESARRDTEELVWEVLGEEDGRELVRILSRLIDRLGAEQVVAAALEQRP